jgi:predicted transcriptional regulator
MSMPKNPHIGGSLEEVLKEEGVFVQTQAQAIKEVVAGERRDATKARPLAQLTALDAAIARGVADAEAGRVQDIDEVRAQLSERVGNS